MRFFLFVVFAAFVIAVNGECASTTSTTSTSTEIQCSAGDECTPGAFTKICGQDDQYCNTADSKCTKNPVNAEACKTAIGSPACMEGPFTALTCNPNSLGNADGTCVYLNYKSGGTACTRSNECISGICSVTANTCSETAADGTCTSNQQCVGGKFCQYDSVTDINRQCQNIYAAGAACYRSSDSCEAGYWCSAYTSGLTNTAGTCVALWSVAVGGQCSDTNQCVKDSYCSSTTYQCTAGGSSDKTCDSSNFLTACTDAGTGCNLATCKCESLGVKTDDDVKSKLTSFAKCLDGANCHATNANTGSCAADCKDEAQDLADELDGDVLTISYREWSFTTTDDLCDSATSVSVSFVFVALMALSALF